jgi:hypothetical protein
MTTAIFSRIALGAILFLAGCDPSETTDENLFYLVEEEVSEMPIKAQVEQHIAVSSPPTKEQLVGELSTRYESASSRRGFKHHRNPTNIYIYIYGSEEQARAGQGTWIAMLAKNHGETSQPTVTINEGRLKALSSEPEERFGLSEESRKRLFSEVFQAERRATAEAGTTVPDSDFRRQGKLQSELAERYTAEVAEKHGLSREDLDAISIEGIIKGWIQ